MQLIELRGRVMTIPVLEKKQKMLRREIENAGNEAERLLKKYEKDRRVVDRIQKDSFSSFLLRLTGRYENKLEKKQREEVTAKLSYDRAVTNRDFLAQEKKALDSRLLALRKEESALKRELDSRRRRLANCPGYAEFEKEKMDIISRMTETEEAIAAVMRTMETAERMLDSLEDAESWADFDVFLGGGILTHLSKYSHIDAAEKEFHTLSSQLQELRLELDCVRGLDISGFSAISSGTRAVDFWLDNIFTDLHVRGKVIQNAEEVTNLLNNLGSVKSALEAKLKEKEALFEESSCREEEFVLSAD